MRTCIVTAEYFKRHETMVNFHIEHLFGGNTCVLYSKPVDDAPFSRPSLHRRSRNAATWLRPDHWAVFGRDVLRHGTVRVPFGVERHKILAFLAEQNVEVGLSEFGTQTVAVAPVFAEAGIPLFGYFRGFDASKTIQTPRKADAYARMMPNLAGIISVSQFLLDNLASKGIRHPNAHVIPSGVDVRRFRPGDKIKNRFLSVGRFVEKKLPLLTLRSFCDAAKAHPDATLEMIGGGPLLEPARTLAAEMGMAERVIFHDAQPHDVVRDRLAQAQFFLQHSVTAPDGNTEGLPTAIQEAMASGAVVLSTRHAGIPEAVEHGVTGMLTDEHDETGFTAAITRLLAGTMDVPAMAARARSLAERSFDNQRLVAKLEDTIRDTLGAPHSPGDPPAT